MTAAEGREVDEGTVAIFDGKETTGDFLLLLFFPSNTVGFAATVGVRVDVVDVDVEKTSK